MKSVSEIEKKGLVVCQFNGDCDYCDKPKGKTFAIGASYGPHGGDVDEYICQKCASKKL